MSQPLMPKATAVWLIDNTALTFEQIGKFCSLHPLEVQGIADGEVAVGIVGRDPITNGELTQGEIARCENDSSGDLEILAAEIEVTRHHGGPKYTPLSKRQNRPDAIAWLTKYHPELSDSQICRLVSTTKPTVVAVRERTHWNMPNLKPTDPITLGLCTQIELDQAIEAALRRQERKKKREEKLAAKAAKEKMMSASKSTNEESQNGLPAAQPGAALKAINITDNDPGNSELELGTSIEKPSVDTQNPDERMNSSDPVPMAKEIFGHKNQNGN